MQETQIRPFGIRDKVGYMFGDFANDFTFILASMIMMKFYTDVMGVSAGLVGVLMMTARFVDAFTDVAMGQIVDRSKPTKAGKFKPWLLRICGPVAVASFLIYGSWFANMPMVFKIVYMFVTYILWGSVFYTGVNIPYGSMASAISADPKDRASLSTFRTIGASLAGLVTGVILPLVVYDNINGVQILNGGKVTVAAGICSVLAILCYLLCYNMCTERVKVEQKVEKFDLVKLLKGLVTNKALIGIVIASICMLLVQLTSQTMTGFVYPDYFGNVQVQAVASMLSMIPTFVLAAIVGTLSMKFGRKELAIGGSLFGAAVYAVMFFMQIKNAWLFAIMNAVAFCGLAFFSLICWAMITDVIDDTEVRTGVRSDGEIYSIYSFARKMGQAASSGVAGGLLTAIGYVSGSTVGQTAQVAQGIYNLSCGVPAIGFVLLAITLAFLYPLNKKRVNENVKALAAKRNAK
ncbi:MAG: MFS transporter [Clostridia bacterium]|nr:MFS transporter [Clostridia bacterium]